MSEIYGKEINTVKKFVRKWLDKKAPNVPEEKKDRFSKALTTILVLGAEYGAGDALAGYILMKILPRSAMENLYKSLNSLGVKNLPNPRNTFLPTTFAMFLLKSDYGDEEMNYVVKELDKMSASGGKYLPKLLEDDNFDKK